MIGATLSTARVFTPILGVYEITWACLHGQPVGVIEGKDTVHSGLCNQASDCTRCAYHRQVLTTAESLEAGNKRAQADAVDEVDASEVKHKLGLAVLEAFREFVLGWGALLRSMRRLHT
jgi:hypothetical protein